MKNLTQIFLITAFLAVIGCTKDDDAPFTPTPDNSTTINYEIGYLTSEKSTDKISPTKSYEDAITMMKVWVFQGTNDNAVLCRDLTSAEIQAMKATLLVSKVTQGEKLIIMAVANLGPIKTTSKKQLLEITDDDPSRYNSESYKDMTTKSLKLDGFTMFSRDEIVIGAETSYTLKNKLEKNVAKIEIIMDNKFMREENKTWGDEYKGFFKAEYLTFESNGCSTEIFGKAINNSLMDLTASAIQPSEFLSQGIGYYCYKPSNGFSLDINLYGEKKTPGSLTPWDKKRKYMVSYRSTILPNKHYVIHCNTTGKNYYDVNIQSFEEKDWVKTN